MAQTITCNCPDCGNIELEPKDFTVRVRASNSQGSYYFTCSDCHKITVKPAEPRTVELLVNGGVRLVIWQEPEEIAEIKLLMASGRPPIEHDELIDFHDAIEERDVMDLLDEYREANTEVALTLEAELRQYQTDLPPDIRNV